MFQNYKILSATTHTFPAEVEQGAFLSLIPHIINKHPLLHLCGAMSFTSVSFRLILLCKMTPTWSTEVLSSVSKYKKAKTCLPKMHQDLQTLLRIELGCFGYEFNVDESMTYMKQGIFKQK